MLGNTMTYQLPRSTFDIILDGLAGDRQKAETVAKTIEEAIQIIDTKVMEQIVEKKEFIKLELKEELKKELVTNETLINVKQELEFKMDTFKQELEFKMDKQDLLIKVLIGLQIIGLTILNPSFVEIIKSFLK